MLVSDRVRVVKLDRQLPAGHAPSDAAYPAPVPRDPYIGKDGLLVQRLSVPWDADLGALWRVRFEGGEDVIFAESELSRLGGEGQLLGNDVAELKENWGKAPRAGSMPFKRRASGGAGQAVLAFIVLSLAGLLLIGAGIAKGDLRMSAAGGALIVVGLGAAAVMLA